MALEAISEPEDGTLVSSDMIQAEAGSGRTAEELHPQYRMRR